MPGLLVIRAFMSAMPLVGAIVALLGGAAAMSVVAKLRALNDCRSAVATKRRPERIALGCASVRE